MRSARELSKTYNPRIRNKTRSTKNSPLMLNSTNIYLGGKSEIIYKDLVAGLPNVLAGIPGKVNKREADLL
jgi:hypothetical protein